MFFNVLNYTYYCSGKLRRADMVKLQFDNNKQFKITLPKAILDAKGWVKGDNIKIELDAQGNILLKRTDEK